MAFASLGLTLVSSPDYRGTLGLSFACGLLSLGAGQRLYARTGVAARRFLVVAALPFVLHLLLVGWGFLEAVAA